MNQHLIHGAEQHFPSVHVMLQVWQALPLAGKGRSCVWCEQVKEKCFRQAWQTLCVAVLAKSSSLVDLLTWPVFQVLWYF